MVSLHCRCGHSHSPPPPSPPRQENASESEAQAFVVGILRRHGIKQVDLTIQCEKLPFARERGLDEAAYAAAAAEHAQTVQYAHHAYPSKHLSS